MSIRRFRLRYLLERMDDSCLRISLERTSYEDPRIRLTARCNFCGGDNQVCVKPAQTVREHSAIMTEHVRYGLRSNRPIQLSREHPFHAMCLVEMIEQGVAARVRRRRRWVRDRAVKR